MPLPAATPQPTKACKGGFYVTNVPSLGNLQSTATHHKQCSSQQCSSQQCATTRLSFPMQSTDLRMHQRFFRKSPLRFLPPVARCKDSFPSFSSALELPSERLSGGRRAKVRHFCRQFSSYSRKHLGHGQPRANAFFSTAQLHASEDQERPASCCPASCSS